MKTVACLAAAVLIAAASASTVAAPLEAYGGLPSVEQVAISPDGKDLALIVTNGDQRALVIETAADQKPFGIVKLGDAKLRVIEWVGDHHVLMTISVHGALQTPYGPILGGGDEHLVAIDYDTADHRQTFLMNDVEHALNVVYREPIARIIAGKPIAYLVGQVFPEGEPTGRIALLRSDLDAHDTKVVDLGLPHVTDWAVDDQGRPLAVAAYDAPSATWTLRVRAGDGWRVLKTVTAPIERPELAGLGRDGRSLLVADWVDNERAFREVAPDAADWSAPIAHGDEEGIHDPATHALIGFAKLDGDVLDYTFFDAKVAATWRAVQAAYPGQEVQLISVSDDRRKLVVRVDSPTDGPAYALVDLDTGAAGWIANEYEGLKAGDIALKRAIGLMAADGRALSGYLTLPPGKPEKALPLVVLRPRRSGGPRHARLRLVGPGSGLTRLCCSSGELPRLGRLRLELPLGRVRPVGTQDADRRLRRRALPGRPRDGRPQARVHRRRKLRRLRGAGRRDHRQGGLPLRRLDRRAFRPAPDDRRRQERARPSGRRGRALLVPLHGRVQRQRSGARRSLAGAPGGSG